MSQSLDKNIQTIDVESVIKYKNPKLLKILPSFLINYIKRIIHQDEINEILNKFGNKYGVDFVSEVLNEFNIKINIIGQENIIDSNKYIFASNHPLGGLDGMVMIKSIGSFGKDVKFIVNDVLLNIKNLEPVFVPVNILGKNNQKNLEEVDKAYNSDTQILVFPAGLVSRKISNKITDLKWRKSFISQAIKYKRDIIPVYIDGKNSNFFYNLSNLRKRLGIKQNIEMFYLPDEMFKQQNKTITIIIGEPIPYNIFDKTLSSDEWAEKIKEYVYSLASKDKTKFKSGLFKKNNDKVSLPLITKRLHLKTPFKHLPPVISPISKEKLEKELTKEKFVRETNYGSNEIYTITYHDSPNVMMEIGRLRELTFRKAGGGTGKEFDIDDYDSAPNPYKQLILWDPKEKEIIGGYRYIICKDAPKDENGNIKLATSNLFHFSESFKNNYLPHLIELGRSFIQPAYQSSLLSRKSIFSLDNLWDGLGALAVDNPDVKYFFGKVTMYTHFNKKARDLILYFLEKHFKDKENLLIPVEPLHINTPHDELEKIFSGKNYLEDYKILSQRVRALRENIPPLINAYMNLSSSMKTFGTISNPHFGNVEETGIMITIDDIYPAKIERHISTYKKKA